VPEHRPHPLRQPAVDVTEGGVAVAEAQQHQAAGLECGDEAVEHELGVRNALDQVSGVHDVVHARWHRDGAQVAQLPRVEVAAGLGAGAQGRDVVVDPGDGALDGAETEVVAGPASGVQDGEPVQGSLAGVVANSCWEQATVVDRRCSQVGHNSGA
jgi:hypothetical protein